MVNYRVKVYHLNNYGSWDDAGTGGVDFADTGTGTLRVTVKSEVDEAELLRHEVDPKIRYQLQGEGTIITWNDPSVGTDVALSFQDKQACYDVWDHVELALSTGNVTGLPMYMLDQNGNPRVGYVGDMYGANGQQTAPEFPDPSLDTLPTISQLVAECSVFLKDVVAKQLVKPGYLKEILHCFEIAEQVEDTQNIKAVHDLVKTGILLNDTPLLELMFSDEYVEGVVAALEYDPNVPEESRVKYREFIKGDMSLKEIVPIVDTACRSKIIQAYRIMYIRDTVLPKTLDDATHSTLSSMHLFNIVEVLVSLNKNPQFFRSFFDKMFAAEKYSDEWRDLLAFLKELICLSRHIQAAQRNETFMHLCNLGLFPVMSDVLASDDMEAKLWAVDCLLAATVHDPVLLRSFIQNNKQGGLIFSQLVTALLTENSGGLQEQCLDIVKILLDPDTMSNANPKEDFVQAFYDEHMPKLMDVVVSAINDEGPCPVSTIRLIIDLLSYCVTQHSYRAKYCILRYNFVGKIMKFLERREKVLAIAAIKCLRTCVLMRDEFYDKYLEKNLLLEEVLKYYIRHCQSDNIVISASIDFLWMLVKENLKSHLSRLMASHLWAQMRELKCDPGLIDEIEKSEMQKDERNSVLKVQENADQRTQEALEVQRNAAVATAMRVKGEKLEDMHEENYFREEADEDGTETPETASHKEQEGTPQFVLDECPPLPPLRTQHDDEDDDDTIPLTVIPQSVKRKSPSKTFEILAEKRHKDG